MAFQTVFKRYEYKYMLDKQQYEQVRLAMEPYMAIDNYGRTTIRNVYFDTDTYLLIRRSIEGPVYKEKLRIRSYDLATPDSTVFVEIKKKYRKIVNKRRVSMSEKEAMEWTCSGTEYQKNEQIVKEINYFLKYYKTLKPTVFLSYEREAFYSKDGSDFRITFDENILCRTDDLTLTSPAYGTSILPEGMTLMEIKCSGGIPLWMTEVLSKQRLYKTSFSKYGTAYKTLIFNDLGGNM